jgi:hypothetical protein
MGRLKIITSISVLLLAMLACNAANGIQLAQTELPAMMTAVPTMLGPVGTAAAEFTPPAIPNTGGTTTPGGLGIALKDVRTVMDASQQFTFTDGSADGKPAAIANLSASAAANMPGLAQSFSAVFIGDPANLSEIKITVPNSSDQAAVDAGTTMMTVLLTGILPPDVLISFVPWLTQNYSSLPVDESKTMTAKNIIFTLSRTQSVTVLDLAPAK